MSSRGGKFKDIQVSGGLVDHDNEVILECKDGFHNPVTSYKCQNGNLPVEDAKLKCYRGQLKFISDFAQTLEQTFIFSKSYLNEN